MRGFLWPVAVGRPSVLQRERSARRLPSDFWVTDSGFIGHSATAMSQGLGTRELAAASRYRQSLLTFEGRAISPAAKALVSYCLNELILPPLPAQQRRPTTIPAIKRAAEATLADLIAATGEQYEWRRRPMSIASFTGVGVSRGQFLKVFEALTSAGLIDAAPTCGLTANGFETLVRLSEAGRKLAARFGVLEPWQQHFAPAGSQSG